MVDFLISFNISSRLLSSNYIANSGSRVGGSGTLGSFFDFFGFDQTLQGLLSGSL